MAISPRYENFSFVGSKEDLFTKYKRKCTTTTVRQKRSKIITFGVVIFLLVALVIGLSVGLHVQKKAKKAEATDKIDTSLNVERADEGETAKMERNVSSAASAPELHTETAEATLVENGLDKKPQNTQKHSTIPRSDDRVVKSQGIGRE